MARHEYKCKDWVSRMFDSISEIEFVQFCEHNKIKIAEYNTDKHLKFQLFDKPPQSETNTQLERKLMRDWFIYECKKMRNMEASHKSFDFVIEIDWIEYLTEIKWEFSNLDKMTHKEKEVYTIWAMQKSIFMDKYKRPIIVFISKTYRGHRVFRAEYYYPIWE